MATGSGGVGIDRPTTPDGVVVGQADLVRLTDAVAAELLRRLGELTGLRQPGALGAVDGLKGGGLTSGGEVTVAASLTQVQVAAGDGYTPSGAYLEWDAVSPLDLPDPAVNHQNYVGVWYRETSDQTGAHETSGVARPRRTLRSSEVDVLTAAEYTALPDTSTTGATEAKDTFLVRRIVYGNGGAGLQKQNDDGTLAAAAVGDTPYGLGSVAYDRILTVTQPSAITGVETIRVSAVTPTDAGAGTLTFVLGVAPLKGTLRWTAPGAAIGPASPDLSTYGEGDPITLASAAPHAARTLQVRVYPSLIPTVAAGPDSITVGAVAAYEPAARRLTALDEAHRHALGGGGPTSANPHGLSFDDLVGRILNVPSTARLGTALTTTAMQAATPRLSVTRVAVGVSPLTYVGRYDGPSGTGAVRTYRGVGISGEERGVVTVNARYLPGVANYWTKDVGAQAAFMAAASPDGQYWSIAYRSAGAAGDWDDSTWTSIPFNVRADLGQTLLARPIVLGGELFTSASDAEVARAIANYSAVGVAARTRLQQSANNAVTGTSTLCTYRAHTSGTSGQAEVLELVFNARWDNGTSRWLPISGAVPAAKVELGRDYVQVVRRTAAAANWTDAAGAGGWDAPGLSFNLTTGELYAAALNARTGPVRAGSTSPTVAQFTTYLPIAVGPVGGSRWLTEEVVSSETGVGYRSYLFDNGTQRRQERTVNCYWSAGQWHADNPAAGSANYAGEGSDGAIRYRQTALGAPWNDPGGAPPTWSSADRAWAYIDCNAGAFTLHAGQNVDPVGIVLSGPPPSDLLVSFLVPFYSTTGYAVVPLMSGYYQMQNTTKNTGSVVFTAGIIGFDVFVGKLDFIAQGQG